MGKCLILVRHAKSSWESPHRDDHQRVLNDRGLRDAPVMGARIAARKYTPALIISSDAERAISTARIIAQQLGYAEDKITPEPELYLASPEQIFKVLVDKSGTHKNIMLVGHNPGMTELANRIGNVRIDNMPTCSAFCVELDINDWQKLPDATGKLLWFDYPRKSSG